HSPKHCCQCDHNQCSQPQVAHNPRTKQVKEIIRARGADRVSANHSPPKPIDDRLVLYGFVHEIRSPAVPSAFAAASPRDSATEPACREQHSQNDTKGFGTDIAVI